MKVSVIIAAYNIQNYISRCLKSVINQTLKEVEIIIVNDGSTDDTLEVIKSVSIHCKNIKIINKENEGLLEARKSGLKVANGEYILFIDGDDWLENEALSKLYENALSNNSDIVIYNAYKAYSDSKEKFITFNCFHKCGQDYLTEFFIGNIMPAIWSKLIRREFIVKNNIEFASNINWGEDITIVTSLLMNRPKVSFVNEYLYNYYQRCDSLSNIKDDKIKEIFDVFNIVEKELKNRNLYNDYKKQFECLIFNNSHLGNICDLNSFKKEYKYVHKKFYNNFKIRNINIRNNMYIMNKINKTNLIHRLRVKLYSYNYYLGKEYDFLKRLVKFE